MTRKARARIQRALCRSTRRLRAWDLQQYALLNDWQDAPITGWQAQTLDWPVLRPPTAVMRGNTRN